MSRPSPRMHPWRRHPSAPPRVALAGVFLALLLAGCGGGGEAAPRGVPGAAEQLLTQADVDHRREGTPEHALLAWWRDMQYVNVAGYVNAFQPSLKERLQQDPKTAEALDYFAGSIRVARPEIVSVQTRGDTATVYTQIDYRTPVGTSRYVTSTRPRAFVLVRRGGRWLLQNDAFIQTSIPENLRRET